ncbi:histone acetyltransferase enoki mushroom isoform X2 [Lycorma delicatula]|uniref:histone acetyltransferase enoki mushroom isoform X2 n=1 Tax=Lycorma delicatula TaxID=130591 RepID=UPI003F514C33
MREQDSVSSSVWQKWILDAIRKIRSQKQRPSVDRICHAVRQHHTYSNEVITEHLERLVSEGSVLKVFNKGQSTYKDPGGLLRRQILINKKSDLSKVVIKAIKELGEKDGSTFKNIEKYIQQSHTLEIESDVSDWSTVLRLSVKRVVEKGLVKQEGKLYRIPNSSSSEKNCSVKTGAVSSVITTTTASTIITSATVSAGVEGTAVEKAEKSARTPKVSSESGSTQKKRSRLSRKEKKHESPKKSVLPICIECLGTAEKNQHGEAEELSACVGCGTSVHLSCVTNAELVTLLRLGKGGRWFCEECRTCAGCNTAKDQTCLLNCHTCDRGYHIGCLEPPADRRPKAPWRCSHCLEHHVTTATVPQTPGAICTATTTITTMTATTTVATPVTTTTTTTTTTTITTPATLKPVSLRTSNSKELKKQRLAARGLTGRKGKRVSVGVAESSSEDVIQHMNSLMASELPPGVTQKDIELFKETRERSVSSVQLLPAVVSVENASLMTSGSITSTSCTTTTVTTSTTATVTTSFQVQPRCPAAIEFGKYEIQTWYSSPFPQEYARLPKLFLCEFCLKYTKSKAVLERHQEKCTWRHPPATEIYRHNDLSVFEVDGNVNKIYCQNLCLLAKLFLDHKTLYYDVEPFLFYVLTKNDIKGNHLIGYFSKEKHCQQKYNVSCIMTMPQYQRHGYGRFLIHFSYLLSKKEGQPGTPEKPLSDLGRVSYHAYWKSIILEYLHNHRDEEFSIEALSHETGLFSHDISSTLEMLGMVCEGPNGEVQLTVDWDVVDAHMKRIAKSKTRIEIDPECLRWTPLISSIANPFREQLNTNEEESEEKEDNKENEMEGKKFIEDHTEIKFDTVSQRIIGRPNAMVDNVLLNKRKGFVGVKRGKRRGRGRWRGTVGRPPRSDVSRISSVNNVQKVSMVNEFDSDDASVPAVQKKRTAKQRMLSEFFCKRRENKSIGGLQSKDEVSCGVERLAKKRKGEPVTAVELKRARMSNIKRNNLLLKPSRLTSVLTAPRIGKNQMAVKMSIARGAGRIGRGRGRGRGRWRGRGRGRPPGIPRKPALEICEVLPETVPDTTNVPVKVTTADTTTVVTSPVRSKASEAARKRWQQRKEKERLQQIELENSKLKSKEDHELDDMPLLSPEIQRSMAEEPQIAPPLSPPSLPQQVKQRSGLRGRPRRSHNLLRKKAQVVEEADANVSSLSCLQQQPQSPNQAQEDQQTSSPSSAVVDKQEKLIKDTEEPTTHIEEKIQPEEINQHFESDKKIDDIDVGKKDNDDYNEMGKDENLVRNNEVTSRSSTPSRPPTPVLLHSPQQTDKPASSPQQKQPTPSQSPAVQKVQEPEKETEKMEVVEDEEDDGDDHNKVEKLPTKVEEMQEESEDRDETLPEKKTGLVLVESMELESEIRSQESEKSSIMEKVDLKLPSNQSSEMQTKHDTKTEESGQQTCVEKQLDVAVNGYNANEENTEDRKHKESIMQDQSVLDKKENEKEKPVEMDLTAVSEDRTTPKAFIKLKPGEQGSEKGEENIHIEESESPFKKFGDTEKDKETDQKKTDLKTLDSKHKEVGRKNDSCNKECGMIKKREADDSGDDSRPPQSPTRLKQKEQKHSSSPPLVVLDEGEKEKQTEAVDADHSTDSTSVKQTPPQPEIPSMGVYTPDSTTNSVHSIHGYGQCDLDVNQLGLESPTSISSNDMTPSVPEPPRPPSVLPPYPDCAQQTNILPLHHHHHHHHHLSSSPLHQYQPSPAPVPIPVPLPSVPAPVSTKHTSNSTNSPSNAGSNSSSTNNNGGSSNSSSITGGSSNTSSSSSGNSGGSSSSSRKSQSSQHHSRSRATPPAPTPPPPAPQPSRHLQQSTYSHHHSHQGSYISMPQTGTYVSVPMTTVIQHRMAQQGSNRNSLGSSSCSVSTPTNFYIHPHSHTPSASPATCSQATQPGTPSCSLAKLQQLTNGLDMITPGHCSATMTPPPPMNLTPPPPSNMTPPPPNLANYHKFYPSNMPPSRSSSRPQMTTAGSPRNPNVSISPNIMAQYSSTFNGYRGVGVVGAGVGVVGQQSGATVTGYITNTGFINQSQIPVQNLYQDQQNTMYTTYGYINSIPMQPLNSTMRR